MRSLWKDIAFIGLMIFLTISSISDAADIIIENKISAPDNRSIWTIDSNKAPTKATVALTVTNLIAAQRPPLDVILALDCSGSLGSRGRDGTDPQRMRVLAAKQFVDYLDANIDTVGVVLWNDTIIESLPLTSDFAEAKNYLELSGSDGYTCLWMALDASKSLLESAGPPAKRVIIIFSDGQDTCQAAVDFKELADQIRNRGVDIYTIGLGASNITDLQAVGKYYHVNDPEAMPKVFQEIAEEIMGSLDNITVKYSLPDEIDISGNSDKVSVFQMGGEEFLTWNAGSILPLKSKTLSFDVSSKYSGIYVLGSSNTSEVSYARRDGKPSGSVFIPSTDITVKEPPMFFYSGSGRGGAAYNEFYPGYRVTVTKDLKAPSNGGCQDIELCIGTPSIPCNVTVVFALDCSGSTMQSELDKVLLNEIGEALEDYPNILYSRVDWSDNYSISSDYIGTFKLAKEWPSEANTHLLRSRETKGTVYSVGLAKAVGQLAGQMRNQDRFTKQTNGWAIIFITGRSEFSKGDSVEFDRSLQTAINNNIKIYPIGVEIYDDDATREEASNLSDIAKRTGTDQRISAISRSPDQISDRVKEILSETCAEVRAKPVAFDAVLTETLYPYLKIVGTSDKPDSQTPHSDGTTTVVWNLGNMSQAQTKCITIATALDISKLPIDVTDKRTGINFTPSRTTPASVVAFRSLADESTVRRSIPLPEGQLSVFCGSPCVCPPAVKAIEAAQISPATNQTSEKPATKPQPGFEVGAAIIGLIIGIYIYKKQQDN